MGRASYVYSFMPALAKLFDQFHKLLKKNALFS